MGLLAMLDSIYKEEFLEKHPSLPQEVRMSLNRLLTGLFAFVYKDLISLRHLTIHHSSTNRTRRFGS